MLSGAAPQREGHRLGWSSASHPDDSGDKPQHPAAATQRKEKQLETSNKLRLLLLFDQVLDLGTLTYNRYIFRFNQKE